jgi:hypothetical protein
MCLPACTRKILLWTVVTLLSCDPSARNAAQVRPPSKTTDVDYAMKKNENDASGPKSTTIKVGGNTLTITLDDAKAMEAALVSYLAAADTKEIEDRDELLQWTRGGPSWIDENGIVRISEWLLEVRGQDLVLTYRMQGMEDAPAIKGYAARLAHEDSWRVVSVHVVRIRRR